MKATCHVCEREILDPGDPDAAAKLDDGTPVTLCWRCSSLYRSIVSSSRAKNEAPRG